MKTTTKIVVFAALALIPMAAFGAEGAQAAGAKKNYLQVLMEGGWAMYPIFAFFIGTVWLIIDNILRTSHKKMMPPTDVVTAKETFLAGDYVGAYQSMKASTSPFSNVVQSALGSIGHGKEATEEALQAGVDKVNSQLQTRINYLSVIGVCTPMVGLLGTVSGMKGAFTALENSGIGDTSALSGAIGEVLMATASGLFIAIPAFMAFYFLRNRLQFAVHTLEEEASTLFRNAPYDYLKDADVGQEETYAAMPNWLGETAVEQSPA
jgi:biopolymer transport protein ExbB